MTYVRLYNARGLKTGVLGVPGANAVQPARTQLWLPNSREFDALWDRANEPPAVLDKRTKSGI